MDWTQALTIIGINAAFFIYLMNRIDSNHKQTNEKLGTINNRITTLEAEVKNTHQRIDSTTQRLTDFQMQVNQRFNTLENYIIPKKVIHDEPKEN